MEMVIRFLAILMNQVEDVMWKLRFK